MPVRRLAGDDSAAPAASCPAQVGERPAPTRSAILFVFPGSLNRPLTQSRWRRRPRPLPRVGIPRVRPGEGGRAPRKGGWSAPAPHVY